MALIIVESPTKARTFNRILKIQKEQASKSGSKKKLPDYFVFATLGHIRDLPSDKMAINFKKNFEPDYVTMNSKQKVVTELKKLAAEHDEIIFATDPDREGEAISYHAAYILGLASEKWPQINWEKKGGPKRIVFHEITPKALEEALKKPESIRLELVKAQQARRILDRVVGYELSPLLWKKMGKNWLSAGRVQTVALRFIVEREKEIEAFPKEDHVLIHANLKDGEELRARLVAKDGKKYEKKHKLVLFAGDYEYTKSSIVVDNKDAILKDLEGGSYKVNDLKDEMVTRYPPPPFTTSLLQQEAIGRYGFTSKMVMRLAQDLYERGLITYHRTDSFNLATTFVFRAKDYIAKTFGDDYTLEKPRGFRTKSATAQEAHEAIRPTKVDRDPADIASEAKLTKNHKLLYELIFNRAVSTQMKEASVRTIKADIAHSKGYELESNFAQVTFDGFLRLLSPSYVKHHQESASLSKGEELTLIKLEDEAKKIKPPPRYSEATLIKVLEARAIGRPSTYAAILSLIQDKGYVEKEGRYLKATYLGTAISDYLSAAFSKLFDTDFTAKMEADLDAIAEGKEEMIEVLSEFYKPFHHELVERQKDETKIEVKEEETEPCPTCGKQLTLKLSKFGKFYACTGYPSCKFTKPYLKKVPNKQCPKCGGEVVVRYSRSKKKFFGCATYPKCDFTAFSFAQLGKAK